MAARLQTRIERIPSGLRRIIITIVVLLILAFLFPLSDDDRRPEPDGINLIIPTLSETLTPDTSPQETVAATAVATITARPSETSAAPAAIATATTSPATTTATNSVMTPNAALTDRATPTVRNTNTPVIVCTPSPRSGWEIYTVRRGDTLQGIANLVDASVADLTAVNCLENPDRITAGQQLWAPALPDPFATPSRTPRPAATPTATAAG